MATSTARPSVQLAARWGLLVGGVFLLGVLVYFAREHTESLRVLVGTLAFPLFSVTVLGGLGYYIATRRLDVAEMLTVLAWVALGFAVMAAVVGWYQLLDTIHDHHVPLVISGLATLSIGGAMGAVVGWYSVRARKTTRAATEAREREAYLERQRETLALIDRTLRHHLLNGLTIVDGHADILGDHVDPEGREYLETVRTQVDEMTATIEDIRDLTEAVYEEETIERIDLVGTVRDELAAVADAYPDADLEVDAPDAAVEITANRLLSNAVSNLLHNAVQHNDSATPRVRVAVSDDGDAATVEVADNGPGIPPERREECFEMGERGPDSDGSGMGLFLARTVVERLGGRLRIVDGDAPGTTVAIELPKSAGESL